MSQLPPSLQAVLEDLAMFGEQDRQMYLIDFSDRFQRVPIHIATPPYPESNHVQECESDAYVFAVPREDGTLDFHFDVLNPQGVSARAFSKIIKEAADGQSADVINSIPSEIVTQLFGKGISMGKGLGLQGILNMVKYFANEHAKRA